MKNYRIIVETQADGKQWFVIQKRVYQFFWIYWGYKCHSMRNKIRHHSMQDAKTQMDKYILTDLQIKQSKIVKREIINLDKPEITE